MSRKLPPCFKWRHDANFTAVWFKSSQIQLSCQMCRCFRYFSCIRNEKSSVSAVTVAERSMLTTMLATMLMWVCDSSLPCCSGWFPGASHVGCLSSGPGGLCQATDRKWSQYAPFPHIVQAGGALQHGKNIIRVFGGMRPTAADILIALFYFIFLHCRGTAHPTRFTTLSGMSKRYEHR